MYVFLFAYAIYAHEDKKMALGLLKLKFLGSCELPNMRAKNQIWIFWENRESYYLLSHLFNPVK